MIPNQSTNPDRWQISVDTGGTFTDCTGVSPGGAVHRVKVLSSSRLRGIAEDLPEKEKLRVAAHWSAEQDIFEGYIFALLEQPFRARVISSDLKNGILILDKPMPAGMKLPAPFEITANEEAPVLAVRLLTGTPLHQSIPPVNLRLGTTRGTNALLERKGARTALILNQGYADLLHIGTQQRPDIFTLNIQKPVPLPEMSFALEGRMNAQGEEVQSIDTELVKDISVKLKKAGFQSVAISFMHSYLNASHEEKVAEVLGSAGIEHLSLGSQLSPTIKYLPRTETAVANAYLAPVIREYLRNISEQLPGSAVMVMTSAGGLNHVAHFYPKDSLLSGPAGGVVGAAHVAQATGKERILTLDMGGTSTDVARYDGSYDYRYELEIGGVRLASPALAIETVAAGGGSVCGYDGYTLTVGPESAGARPGPACYGAGGPLTITDVNLLMGRTDPDTFNIPLYLAKAEQALQALMQEMNATDPGEVLKGFLQIANEKMAEAIRNISQRKGYDPSEHALLAFGGAGGQHACKVAEILGMSEVVIPIDAGILSAVGIAGSAVTRIVQKQVLKPLDELSGKQIDALYQEGATEAKELLAKEGIHQEQAHIKDAWLYIRLKGQETPLEVPYSQNPLQDFKAAYTRMYGHYLEGRRVEVESLKVVAATVPEDKEEKLGEPVVSHPESHRKITTSYTDMAVAVFDWGKLKAGSHFGGPAILVSDTCTVYVEEGWTCRLDSRHTACLEMTKQVAHEEFASEEVQLGLFTNRFRSIASEMGALLERTSFSVNIKERLDFSCALMDTEGRLVVNAPHIPVHLGSMGLCVRTVANHLPLEKGDIIITNHPGYGGSHLPDITLISAVFDDEENLLGYLANRAHHAELGGKIPGSMPPDARNLEEEGVVIAPHYLFRKGEARWKETESLLCKATYPSRNPQENLADLRGAVASLKRGEELLRELAKVHGTATVIKYMGNLRRHAQQTLAGVLKKYEGKRFVAEESLDDGHLLRVEISVHSGRLTLNFEGTSEVHPGNYNATPAIVRSVVMYVLRLMAGTDIPLNEGLMEDVEIITPRGMLNPEFPDDPGRCPPVVGGNTEVSQRLTDTLLKAFGMAACSQGTMNNVVFGNESFGYYETIGGGAGAGPDFNGAHAVHQHMTNTRITDPEIMEWRYPVQLEEFSIRKDSGGKGRYAGGDGILRRIRFLSPVSLAILAQHRKTGPYGLEGGSAGLPGAQQIMHEDGTSVSLAADNPVQLKAGDTLIIETPGGGGYGKE